MSDPIFIDSPVNVLRGDAAQVALTQTNDSAYATPDGVLSVPLERWQQAQVYELATWLTYGLGATEDRNTEHANLFGGYEALPEYLGDSVLEIGCGAFTNIREILIRGHKTKRVYLNDPLAREYQKHHPHCAYKDGKIAGYDTYLFSEPIEDITQEGVVDTLIMVNVLSHCHDANAVFNRINNHLVKGGYLVFSEPARDIDVSQVYDVGHPLSYTQDVIDNFLKGYKQVYRNGDYFIGTKK